jgi:hypothetical protein
MFQPDYDHDTDENDNLSNEPAYMHSAFGKVWTASTYKNQGGIAGSEVTSISISALDNLYTYYLLIPYNKRGEAGPWLFASNETARGVVTLTKASVEYYHTAFVDLFVDCNDEVDHIDVYSTMAVDRTGEASIAEINSVAGLSIDAEIEKWGEGAFTWWFRDKIKPVETTLDQTRYIAKWTDTEHLTPAPLYEAVFLAKTTDVVGVAGLDYFVDQDIKDNFTIEPTWRTPSRVLDEERNLWRCNPASYDVRTGLGNGSTDALTKDAGGAGVHHIKIVGDYTSIITAGDWIYIRDELVSSWDGWYGVDSLSFAGGSTTIVSSNFTSSPAATVSPMLVSTTFTYFTNGPELRRLDGVGARTMYNHNGVMMYGNATIAKPDVRQNIAHITAGGAGAGDKYGMMFEYRDENNETGTGPFFAPIYSPSTEFDLEFLQMAWNGELALQIWKYDGSGDDSLIANYTLMDRVTPSDEGWFHTTITSSSGVQSKWAYWMDNPDRATHTPVTYKTPSAGYYTLPNVAWMSDVNRPVQVTYNQFMVPENATIRAITPARLEEAEGIASYDFLVFTDRSVHVYKRDGFRVVEIQKLANDFGVALASTGDIGVNHATSTPTTQHALVAPFEGGVVFIGTDNRVYVISGRRITPLDDHVRGLFSTTFRDIAYHEKENEIWVAVSDNEIWVYDLELDGWNKNYVLPTAWDIKCLFYSRLNTEMQAYVDTDGGGTYAAYIFNDGGSALTSGVATQELSQDGSIMRIGRLVVDYERSDYSGSNRAKVLHYVDARTDNQAEDLLDVLESNAKKRLEYTVPRQLSVYPTLVGRRHQLKVSEFGSLDSILISLEEQDEHN